MQAHLEKLYKTYRNGQFSANGLSSSQVKVNRELYGRNILTRKGRTTIFRRVINAICEPMILILVFAFLITLGVNIGNYFAGNAVDPLECIGIFLSICVSVGLTVIMECKSENTFEALKKITDNVAISCIRDGEKVLVDNSDVCVGDVVMLESGDKVVADCVIISADGLEVDESMLTGESTGISKKAYKSGDFNDCNILSSGTYIKAGNATAIVLAVGDSARVGDIASGLISNDISAPLAEKLTSLSKKITVFGAISAIAVFCLTLIRMLITESFSIVGLKDAFLSGIVLIVAAVPEGLPTTVAISLALSVLRLAKSNAVIKKLVAAETVGCVSVICSDKTGTLTFGVMEVDCFVANTRRITKNETAFKNFYSNIVYNSTATFINDGKKTFAAGNSTERALIEFLFKDNPKGLDEARGRLKIIERTPFSSEKKYMSTTVEDRDGKTTYYKGGIETIISICGLNKSVASTVMQQAARYENSAERVLAFARKIGDVYYFDGFCAVTDKVRPEVAESVYKCKRAGIDVKILTGDNMETAVAVASKIGLTAYDDNCLTGAQVAEMSDEQLSQALKRVVVVARCYPETKLRIVRSLKKSGEVVAVTGDGVNDAPAVKNADIGIAVGDGSEITKEASDIILLDNSFAVIVKAVSFGRNIYKNFQSFIFFQLTVNFSAVGVIFLFLLLGYAPPFSALQLLWINVIMDGPLALSLGLEKRSDEFLDEKPVRRSDEIVKRSSFMRIVLHSAYCVALLGLQKTCNFLKVQPNQSDTAIFCLFILMQMFNAVNARELGRNTVFKTFLQNKLFVTLLLLTICFQVMITEFCGSMFDTVGLNILSWIKIILVAGSVVVISECYKSFYRNTVKIRVKISKRRKFA